jgi:hypothetical protein
VDGSGGLVERPNVEMIGGGRAEVVGLVEGHCTKLESVLEHHDELYSYSRLYDVCIFLCHICIHCVIPCHVMYLPCSLPPPRTTLAWTTPSPISAESHMIRPDHSRYLRFIPNPPPPSPAGSSV